VARIRTIKPQFFLNEQLAALGYGDRLLFIGLWTQADKAGRLEYRPLRIKAALFPYDDFNVTEGLGRLVNAGLITRYEGNGLELVAITTWAKHQRPHNTEADSDLPAPPLINSAVPVIELVEGKGKEGKGKDPALIARFERFWEVYPLKVGKDAARKEWLKRSPDDDLTTLMIKKVREHEASPQWRDQDGKFIPHPRTWLHQGRWQDQSKTHVGHLQQGKPTSLRVIEEMEAKRHAG
jgi:hypothetical protein